MSKLNPSTPNLEYRVSKHDNGYFVSTMRVDGLLEVGLDQSVEGEYSDFGQLPVFMQQGITLLNMLDPRRAALEGVGRRVSEGTWWIETESKDEEK